METPLELPPRPGTREVSWIQEVAAAKSISPFSLVGQVYDWGGKRWLIVVKMPAMSIEDGQAWQAFFGDLNGQAGTFFMRETSFIRETGIDYGMPELDGDHVTGVGVRTRLWTKNMQVLRKGQKIEIAGRIRMVLEDVFSDNDGTATVRCWPDCRSIPDGMGVTWQDPRGVFRVSSAPDFTWNKSRLQEGFQFSAEEVILS